MQIESFGKILIQNGIRHGAGVPCSFFTPLVNHMTVTPELDYISATSEGEAVAIAAGLTAAGKPAFALMQNSGLGNAVNPITSMLYIYRMPVTLLVSHRGEPGTHDEPQHELMGKITTQLAELCALRTHRFEPEGFETGLRAASRDGVPAAWIFSKDALEGGPKLPAREFQVQTGEQAMVASARFSPSLFREQALAALLPLINDGLPNEGRNGERFDGQPAAAVIATTGKLSRELYELDDRDGTKHNRFYMVGSMGCAAPFAVGISRAQPQRPVVVLDGDGALLMKLGTLATIGSLAPKNFRHVVFDNGAHDSTGGQPTPSANVDFARIALACGYRQAATVSDPEALQRVLRDQLQSGDGPTLLRVVIRTGSRKDLGRPKLSPRDNWLRFVAFLAGGEAARWQTPR
jgi:phosphonopyruvate decarboxylase